ncbi:MAG: hypothetical protein WBA60_07780, partial [Methylovirgula sp.]
IATSLRNQGLGSVLERLATAAQQGNLGAAAGSGGLMGIVSSLLGGLLGGSKSSDSSSLSSGLSALTKLFEPGALPASVTQSGLQDSIGKILNGRS